MFREPDYAALAEFRLAIRRFLAFSEAAARAAGLEPAQHQLLLALKGLPAGARPTIRAVAEQLLLRHHSTVGLVNRLVRRGYLRRRRGKEDAREVHLEITRSGESVLRRLSVAHQAELRSAAPLLARSLDRSIRRRSSRTA